MARQNPVMRVDSLTGNNVNAGDIIILLTIWVPSMMDTVSVVLIFYTISTINATLFEDFESEHDLKSPHEILLHAHFRMRKKQIHPFSEWFGTSVMTRQVCCVSGF